MRHKCNSSKLGRSGSHKRAMLAAQVCSLILEKKIKTTQAKAKQSRKLAEKMVTLGKRGDLASRRRALSILKQRKAVSILFDDVAPECKDRQGGYTRVTKLGTRPSDSSEMVLLEWVGVTYTPGVKKAETEEVAAS